MFEVYSRSTDQERSTGETKHGNSIYASMMKSTMHPGISPVGVQTLSGIFPELLRHF